MREGREGTQPVWYPRALVLDIDGVVNWRIPFQYAGLPIIGQHNARKYSAYIGEVPVDTGPADDLISLRNLVSVWRHYIAPVFPDVTRVIKGLDMQTAVFGNTGREKELNMVRATWDSLDMAGIDSRFREIYFKPVGQKTVEHKLAVTKKIAEKYGEENIVVADDNPFDLLPQAARLPTARFILIKDYTTNKLLKGIDMSKHYPNVVIGRTFRHGLNVVMALELPVAV